MIIRTHSHRLKHKYTIPSLPINTHTQLYSMKPSLMRWAGCCCDLSLFRPDPSRWPWRGISLWFAQLTHSTLRGTHTLQHAIPALFILSFYIFHLLGVQDPPLVFTFHFIKLLLTTYNEAWGYKFKTARMSQTILGFQMSSKKDMSLIV